MGIKSFLMKKALQHKMKDVPKDQQEKAMAMVEKDPELFQKIAMEVQVEMKNGKDQMSATMHVMQKYQDQLKGLM